MKQITNFKSIAFQTLFITAILFGMTSCSDTSKIEDSKEVAEDHNDAKFDNRKNEKDAQFLVNAAEINLEEIQLGKLAQEKGSLTDVKTLGKMMEDDHSIILAELTALAGKKQISVPTTPTEKSNDDYSKLSGKSGSDFDKDYCEKMVNGHKNAIAKFENASTESTDAEIKEWATAKLTGLRTHLDHALTCQKKCEQKNK